MLLSPPKKLLAANVRADKTHRDTLAQQAIEPEFQPSQAARKQRLAGQEQEHVSAWRKPHKIPRRQAPANKGRLGEVVELVIVHGPEVVVWGPVYDHGR